MENSKLNEGEQIKPINKTNKGESDLCKNSKMLYVRSKTIGRDNCKGKKRE